MHPRSLGPPILVAALLFSGTALAQTADLEGHVFNRRTGLPLSGVVVVVHETVTAGPVPIELARAVTDRNGFYQLRIPTPTFSFAGAAAFCRLASGRVVRGASSTPLEPDVIRRRDIYLETPRRLGRCLPPEPGDIPPFRR